MSKLFYYQILADRFVLNLKKWKTQGAIFPIDIIGPIPIWILPLIQGGKDQNPRGHFDFNLQVCLPGVEYIYVILSFFQKNKLCEIGKISVWLGDERVGGGMVKAIAFIHLRNWNASYRSLLTFVMRHIFYVDSIFFLIGSSVDFFQKDTNQEVIFVTKRNVCCAKKGCKIMNKHFENHLKG